MSRLRAPRRVAAQLLTLQDLTGSQHAAGLQRQEAQNGCKHRRLTGTGGAGHRSPGARAGVHVQVGEDRVIHAGPACGSVLQAQCRGGGGDLHAEFLRGSTADQGGFAGLRRAHRARLSISRGFGAVKAVGALTVSFQQLLHLGLRAGTQTLNTTRQNVGVHLSLGRHGTLQGRDGNNTLQGYVAHARGNRCEQAAERGPGADRLNMAQGAFQHAGAQQHHNRRFGGTHGAVNSQRVRNDCARQSRTEPAEGHEGTTHALSGRALLQGGQVLGVQGAVSLLSGGCHAVSAQILSSREHAGTQAQHLRGGAASQRLRTGIGAEHNPRSHKSADQHGKQDRDQSLRQDARGRNQRRGHDQQVRSRRDNNARHAVTQLINTAHEAFEQRVTTQQGTHAAHALPCANPGAQTQNICGGKNLRVGHQTLSVAGAGTTQTEETHAHNGDHQVHHCRALGGANNQPAGQRGQCRSHQGRNRSHDHRAGCGANTNTG